LIQGYIANGSLQREARKLAAEDLADNLPSEYVPNSWKNIGTCAKNWYQYMNAFGGIVGAFFFPEDDLSRSQPPASQWTHSTFGTHVTSAEMTVLLELIGRVFPGIQHTFRGTALEQLAKDMRDERRRPGFQTLPWEAGMKGIQHALPLLADHPIVNWKLSEDPNDWARANPMPVNNLIEELDGLGEAEDQNMVNNEAGVGAMEMGNEGEAALDGELIRV